MLVGSILVVHYVEVVALLFIPDLSILFLSIPTPPPIPPL